MAKVEAVKRTKIRRAEFVQLYKEDEEWDAWPNEDDTINKEGHDKGFESENCGEPQKNYKDEKYITNNEWEVALQNFFEQNTVWDFIYLKTLFDQEKYFFLFIVYVVKFTNHGCIEADLGDIGLCHKKQVYYQSTIL